jgi:hypothetical protein
MPKFQCGRLDRRGGAMGAFRGEGAPMPCLKENNSMLILNIKTTYMPVQQPESAINQNKITNRMVF